MPQPRQRWDDEQRLPPWVVQAFGAVLTASVFVFYYFTGEVSPLLLSAATALIGAGSIKAATQNIARRRTAERAVTHARRAEDPGSDEL